jgi:hypothetical protein
MGSSSEEFDDFISVLSRTLKLDLLHIEDRITVSSEYS